MNNYAISIDTYKNVDQVSTIKTVKLPPSNQKYNYQQLPHNPVIKKDKNY